MKTLKLDHAPAQEVLAGSKTSTWRLYDDKELSVNDDVRLIDKVNPADPDTWKVIGTAHIVSIVQKRLGDVGRDDYEKHEAFTDHWQMLQTYRKYYGPQVDNDTVIKIIRFTFNNDSTVPDGIVGKNTSKITEVK